MMDYILNDLSIPKGNLPAQDAKAIMKDFVSACSELRKIGFSALRIPSELYSTSLSEEYFVYSWLDDGTVDLDLRRQFKSISTNSPQLPDTEEEINEVFYSSDFYFKGQQAVGLGVAYLFSTVAVSFKTSEDWCSLTIELDHHLLNENGDIIESKVSVKNAFDRTSASSYKIWVGEERLKRLNNSGELWEKRSELFSRLIFCDGVESQLTSYGLNDSNLHNIIDKLTRLNAYCEGWTIGAFDRAQTGCNISGESEPTMQKYGKYRKFRVPSGEYRTFEDHIKVGDTRIHFFVDTDSKSIFIGYIGKHLPTVKFN